MVYPELNQSCRLLDQRGERVEELGSAGTVDDPVVERHRESQHRADRKLAVDATGRSAVRPTARIAACGALTIAWNPSTPYMPRFDSVKAPPWTSAGRSLPVLAASASSRRRSAWRGQLVGAMDDRHHERLVGRDRDAHVRAARHDRAFRHDEPTRGWRTSASALTRTSRSVTVTRSQPGLRRTACSSSRASRHRPRARARTAAPPATRAWVRSAITRHTEPTTSALAGAVRSQTRCRRRRAPRWGHCRRAFPARSRALAPGAEPWARRAVAAQRLDRGDHGDEVGATAPPPRSPRTNAITDPTGTSTPRPPARLRASRLPATRSRPSPCRSRPRAAARPWRPPRRRP